MLKNFTYISFAIIVLVSSIGFSFSKQTCDKILSSESSANCCEGDLCQMNLTHANSCGMHTRNNDDQADSEACACKTQSEYLNVDLLFVGESLKLPTVNHVVIHILYTYVSNFSTLDLRQIKLAFADENPPFLGLDAQTAFNNFRC